MVSAVGIRLPIEDDRVLEVLVWMILGLSQAVGSQLLYEKHLVR